jgi:hypothetical protein
MQLVVYPFVYVLRGDAWAFWIENANQGVQSLVHYNCALSLLLLVYK